MFCPVNVVCRDGQLICSTIWLGKRYIARQTDSSIIYAGKDGSPDFGHSESHSESPNRNPLQCQCTRCQSNAHRWHLDFRFGKERRRFYLDAPAYSQVAERQKRVTRPPQTRKKYFPVLTSGWDWIRGGCKCSVRGAAGCDGRTDESIAFPSRNFGKSADSSAQSSPPSFLGYPMAIRGI